MKPSPADPTNGRSPICSHHLSIAGWSTGEGPSLDPEDFFWPSTKGGGLAYTYVGSIITETTRRELGVAVNPHLFRDCAVYTVADTAGDEMGVASALLQHSRRAGHGEALQQGLLVQCCEAVSRNRGQFS